jgi:hypothetical protein
MAVNKQPIFTATSILTTAQINSGGTVFDTSDILAKSDVVFTASSPEGTLIERVTITAKADPSNGANNVSNKLIYLSVYDGTTYAVLRVIKFTGVTVDDATLPPSEIITFEGGIVLKDSDVLLIGQTVVNGDGDGLYIVVEGGTYTQP